MDLTNTSGLPVLVTAGAGARGRTWLTVIAKAGWRIGDDLRLTPLDAAPELLTADRFLDEPGLSAPRLEADVAATKPRCDLVVLGDACAPGGTPTTHIAVALHAPGVDKRFTAVGDRRWRKRLLGIAPGEPAPAARIPIGYDRAWGGADRSAAEVAAQAVYGDNPVGRGFAASARAAVDQPLPNTEGADGAPDRPDAARTAWSLGVVGRNWRQRLRRAGTMDDAWLAERAPLLPDDFDDAYHQCTADDQQCALPDGDTLPLRLVGLDPRGVLELKVPVRPIPVNVLHHDLREHDTLARVDTVVIDLDARTVTATWRATAPVRRLLVEVAQVTVGALPPSWFRARRLGKTWYPDARALIATRRP
jgi:hypothetical protein